jgi:hypothetical protein
MKAPMRFEGEHQHQRMIPIEKSGICDELLIQERMEQSGVPCGEVQEIPMNLGHWEQNYHLTLPIEKSGVSDGL